MKTSLLSITIVISLMVGPIYCQEEDGSSLLTRFKDLMKSFWNSITDFWKDFKQEVKARTTDMRDWSQEVFDSFKVKMKEWIENNKESSDTEKEEMRRYLDRFQMKNESDSS